MKRREFFKSVAGVGIAASSATAQPAMILLDTMQAHHALHESPKRISGDSLEVFYQDQWRQVRLPDGCSKRPRYWTTTDGAAQHYSIISYGARVTDGCFEVAI